MNCTRILSQLSRIRQHCLAANAALGGGDSITLEQLLQCIEARVQAIREEMKRR